MSELTPAEERLIHRGIAANSAMHGANNGIVTDLFLFVAAAMLCFDAETGAPQGSGSAFVVGMLGTAAIMVGLFVVFGRCRAASQRILASGEWAALRLKAARTRRQRRQRTQSATHGDVAGDDVDDGVFVQRKHPGRRRGKSTAKPGILYLRLFGDADALAEEARAIGELFSTGSGPVEDGLGNPDATGRRVMGATLLPGAAVWAPSVITSLL